MIKDVLSKLIKESEAKNSVLAGSFEMNWETLPPASRQLGCLLSLFANIPIPWSLVELVVSKLSNKEFNQEAGLKARDILVEQHLLQQSYEEAYLFHSLIRELFQEKLEQLPEAEEFKTSFCKTMVERANRIPQQITLELVEEIAPTIPHIAEAATTWKDFLSGEDLIVPFIGLGRYYKGIGASAQAEPWLKECLLLVEKRLDKEHSSIATVLNNLAELYKYQGRYDEAEPLYFKALELDKKLLGENSHEFVLDLNNIAGLYRSQQRYDEAKSLYLQARDLCEHIHGKEGIVALATIQNNLASVYSHQENYSEAEPLFKKVLDLWKSIVGEKPHLTVATTLNNLAKIYSLQERYSEAEPLYVQTLDLFKILLGEKHKDVARCMFNLGELYFKQKRYQEAETWLLQALEIQESVLGSQHPDTIDSQKLIDEVMSKKSS